MATDDVLNECDGMNLCIKNIRKKQKEWDWGLLSTKDAFYIYMYFCSPCLYTILQLGFCVLYLQIYFYNW
jgi:hypothetical protein